MVREAEAVGEVGGEVEEDSEVVEDEEGDEDSRCGLGRLKVIDSETWTAAVGIMLHALCGLKRQLVGMVMSPVCMRIWLR